MAETFSGNEFGTYIIEPTTGDDVRPFTKWFENRFQLLDNPSKSNAVYTREIKTIQACFRRTSGVLVKRKLDNNTERIVAYTGAYPITEFLEIGECNDFIHAPRIRIDDAEVFWRPVEIGTTIAIPKNDIPNADGHTPSHWLFNVLIPAAVCNLFYLGDQESGGQYPEFDTMIANVQERLGKIQTRLEPLGWRQIKPSPELIAACAGTTTNQSYNPKPIAIKEPPPFRPRNTYFQVREERMADPNFMGLPKRYYQLHAAGIARHAELFLDTYNNQYVVSGHKENKQTIHVEMRFPKGIDKLMYACMGKDYSKEDRDVGYSDLRRRIFRHEDRNIERGRALWEQKHSWKMKQLQLAYA